MPASGRQRRRRAEESTNDGGIVQVIFMFSGPVMSMSMIDIWNLFCLLWNLQVTFSRFFQTIWNNEIIERVKPIGSNSLHYIACCLCKALGDFLM